MANNLMERLRSFFGLRQEPPRNDFRNPIWSSEDEDDGDDIFSRSHSDAFRDHVEFHREITRQVQDLFQNFGSIFGDMGSFLEEQASTMFRPGNMMIDGFTEPENFDNNNIRDYYLKPGYQHNRNDLPKDYDLDGKISSNDISGLLNQKQDGHGPIVPATPFNGNLVPGRSFCQTIITTTVTKPDGSVETRRIVKMGNDVIESNPIINS